MRLDVQPRIIHWKKEWIGAKWRQQIVPTNGYKTPPLVTILVGISWWRHQMETFSEILAICAENSPVTGEFPAQRWVTRSFDVFFDLCLNKLLSKQSWGWWFQTPSRSLWRHCNVHRVFSFYLYTFSWLLHHNHFSLDTSMYTETIIPLPKSWYNQRMHWQRTTSKAFEGWNSVI